MTTDDVPATPIRRMIRFAPTEEFFWRLGRDGLLRFLGCGSCGRLHHPPLPRCPFCHGARVEPTAVSGRAAVASFTVNRQPFLPDFPPPYVIAIVEIAEDPSIRLTTNLVGCTLGEVEIGLDVEVVFEEMDGLFVPLFQPASQ